MKPLEEQVITIERALGERMIKHALFVMRQWLNELGDGNTYEDTYHSLFEHYSRLFENWLVSAGNNEEDSLNTMTTETYRFVDEVYAALRIKRGLSPSMHGFNGENPQSVMHYFSSCVQFSESDMQWLRMVLDDTSHSSIALMAVAAMAKNMRECFQENAFIALIEGANAANPLVAEQCLANSLLLLAHYDVRIDFFPEIQDAFLTAIGDGEHAFEILCALIRSTKVNLSEMVEAGELDMQNLPEELRNLINASGMKDIYPKAEVMMPSSEREYMSGIVQMLPETWVYMAVVGENEERKRKIQVFYLSIGSMDMLWDNTDTAEQLLVKKMRAKGGDAMDYINYGHCLLLRGDRMMAYENYHEARRKCKTAKEFYALFRPGRKQLVERGIPVEQVYLIEDQLFSI